MSKTWMKLIMIGTLMILLAACSGSPATAVPADNGASPAVQQDTAAPEIDAAGIFASRCAGCHGADRSGRNGPALLPERLTKDPSEYVAIITNGSGAMPAWGSRLSAEEINALVDYILSTP